LAIGWGGNVEMRIKEKIVCWIVMLDSPDFKGTDAEIVREEMLDLIKLKERGAEEELKEGVGE